MAKPMWSVKLAHETDDEHTIVEVNSREFLVVERAVKGFSVSTFFRNLTMTNVYRALHIILRNRGGVLPEGLTLAQFEAEYEILLNTDEDEEADEEGVDPTRTAP